MINYIDEFSEIHQNISTIRGAFHWTSGGMDFTAGEPFSNKEDLSKYMRDCAASLINYGEKHAIDLPEEVILSIGKFAKSDINEPICLFCGLGEVDNQIASAFKFVTC